ncbi:hypothetical protein Agub_g2563 [Astrephomene gubernaculifera]|uniref:U-box domain-containing protein n=1 Tax=Astrephomene gubernaculifera TaxID=47775 RepID=A0AAD3HI72_9CHLO|nr:hypothetical protein Agub_g2563 [Astrephomene gubernaculifera]
MEPVDGCRTQNVVTDSGPFGSELSGACNAALATMDSATTPEDCYLNLQYARHQPQQPANVPLNITLSYLPVASKGCPLSCGNLVWTSHPSPSQPPPLRVPRGFICPIEGTVMRDPVNLIALSASAATPTALEAGGPEAALTGPAGLPWGLSYERAAVSRWLSSRPTIAGPPHQLPLPKRPQQQLLQQPRELSQPPAPAQPGFKVVPNVPLRLAIQEWLRLQELDHSAADQLLLLEAEAEAEADAEAEAEAEAKAKEERGNLDAASADIADKGGRDAGAEAMHDQARERVRAGTGAATAVRKTGLHATAAAVPLAEARCPAAVAAATTTSAMATTSSGMTAPVGSSPLYVSHSSSSAPLVAAFPPSPPAAQPSPSAYQRPYPRCSAAGSQGSIRPAGAPWPWPWALSATAAAAVATPVPPRTQPLLYVRSGAAAAAAGSRNSSSGCGGGEH